MIDDIQQAISDIEALAAQPGIYPHGESSPLAIPSDAMISDISIDATLIEPEAGKRLYERKQRQQRSKRDYYPMYYRRMKDKRLAAQRTQGIHKGIDK